MSQAMKTALVMACDDQLRALKLAGQVTPDSQVTAEALAYAYFKRARLLQRKASRLRKCHD